MSGAGSRRHPHHPPIIEGAARLSCIVASTEGRRGKPDKAEPREYIMIKADKAEDTI